MKSTKYLFTLLFCLFSLSAMAQDIVPQDLSKTGSRDRVIFELNWNGWRNQPDSILNTKWYGRGVNLYTFYDFKLGEQDFVSFGLGGGLSNNNVYHRSNLVQVTDTATNLSSNTFEPIPISRTVKTNKIGTTFFEIPMELRFRTKPDKFGKRIKVSPGVRLGYLLNGVSKYSGKDDTGADVKTKTYKLPYINKYRVSTSLRVGYGNFSLVGAFSLSSLFEKDKGPGLKPFSVGVSFNSF